MVAVRSNSLSLDTQSALKTNSSILSNHIVSIEKMDGFNYSTWVCKIRLLLSGLEYKSLLITTVESLPIEEREQWIKIDVPLCSVIKSIIHTLFKPFLCSYEMCASV